MLQEVSSISEKLGRLGLLDHTETMPHLRKNNRIRSIHSSLRIEANSLSLEQVRDAIGGKAVYGDQKEIQEVKNAYSAYEELSRIDPYRIEDLLRLHGVMMSGIIPESGVFRGGEEGVFSGGVSVFMAPPAKLVPSLMDDLFVWMESERENIHPLILSAVFHYEFVFIHPFADGNGRMARLWHTALLTRWKPVFAYVPIESQIERFQTEYYDAIASCHKAGDSDAFIEFALKMIDCALEAILKQEAKENDALSKEVRRLLSAMEFGVSYTAKALMTRLRLKSKETFRKHYLNPAMELHLIEMTEPEKPTSRNQRYRRL